MLPGQYKHSDETLARIKEKMRAGQSVRRQAMDNEVRCMTYLQLQEISWGQAHYRYGLLAAAKRELKRRDSRIDTNA